MSQSSASVFVPAVGLDVLYEWRKKTKKGIPFFTFWNDLMDVYDNHGFCQLLRPRAFPLVRRLLEEGNPASLLPMSQQHELQALCPILWSFLRPYIGSGLPDDVASLLSSVLGVAGRCFIPQEPGIREAPAAQVAAAAASSSRGAAAFQEHMSSGGRPPEEWSREEAFLRTGCFGGPCCRQPWTHL